MWLFKRKHDYANLISKLNAELEGKCKDIVKLTKTIKTLKVYISDLEATNELLKKMITDRDMKMVKKDIEIKELKEKIDKLKNTTLHVVK